MQVCHARQATDSVFSDRALVRQVKHLPARLMSSLAWDRGTELADHKRFTVVTDLTAYFCDPQSPWQRQVFSLVTDPVI